MKLKSIFTIFTIITLSFSLLVFSYASNLTKPKESMTKILQQFVPYITQVQKQWQVPGMAIAVVHDGKIVFAKGYGIRNVQGAPVTANTVFDIASLTKSFTSVLLAMQIDAGDYNWNSKVIKLLPNFKLYNKQLTNDFEVRDLIAHDSGLPAGALGALGNFGYSVKHTMDVLQYIKPVAPFRSTFAYQDVFLEFAKKIIEQESHQSFTEVIRHKIFLPLGMKDTYIRTQKSLLKNPNRAQPFLYFDGKNYPYSKKSPYLVKPWALKIGIAGGGIQSSAYDVAKWLIFNMSGGCINGKTLVNHNNLNFIHSPQTIIKKSKNNQVTEAYGEGWFINNATYAPYTVLYHPGGGTGMHAFMAYIPKTQTGIVVLTNQYINFAPKALFRRLFDLYFGIHPLKDWSKVFLKQRFQFKHVQSSDCLKNSNHSLNQYVGNYYNPVYGHINLSLDGNKLIMPIGPNKIKWYLSFCRPGVLKAYWPNPNGMNIPMLLGTDALVHFKFNKQNQVKEMIVPFLNSDGSGELRRLNPG